MKQPKKLVGWRYGLFVGAFISAIGMASYPVIISPMINADYYKKIQSVTRKDINQEEIQPGNMKVWTDPFDRKKD